MVVFVNSELHILEKKINHIMSGYNKEKVLELPIHKFISNLQGK